MTLLETIRLLDAPYVVWLPVPYEKWCWTGAHHPYYGVPTEVELWWGGKSKVRVYREPRVSLPADAEIDACLAVLP